VVITKRRNEILVKRGKGFVSVLLKLIQPAEWCPVSGPTGENHGETL
jgi:hypothetical protein